MAKLDPQQAATTKKIVKTCGDEHVCSLCGDRPASEYEIANKWFDAETPVTFRLCEVCPDEGDRFAAGKGDADWELRSHEFAPPNIQRRTSNVERL